MKIRFLSLSLSILALGVVVLLSFLFWRPKTGSPPNIVFILLDAARADHFSGYGYPKNTTPSIDRISHKGALFLQNFSPDTATSMSLPKIFFSRYFSLLVYQKDSRRWRIKTEYPDTIFQTFDSQQILLSEALSRHRYRTVLFHNHPLFSKESYFGQKFDEAFAFRASREHPSDREIISSVISWLEKKPPQPFFVYCHIMSPHEPYPPKEEDGEFLGGEHLRVLEQTRKKFLSKKDNSTRGWSPEDLRYLNALYDSNLKHSDKWVGALYDKLEELGLANNTIFIITADHGEHLGQHNSLSHGWLPWDSVTHVPLIMVYPPAIPPGLRVKGMTESIDIFPTILDLAGLKLPGDKSTDGISLVKSMRQPDWGKKAVFTRDSIRTAEYKYIVSRDLLYDLNQDPDEKENISDQKPLIKEKFLSRYKETMKPYRDRYENSRRDGPPDYPFYFILRDFELTPPEVFAITNDSRDTIIVLKEAASTKPWLNNRHFWSYGLFRTPVNSSPSAITLSATLPNGTYRVSVLLETSGDISLPKEEFGFKSRFDPRQSFAPAELIPTGRKINNRVFSYLDLGETVVREEQFRVEIDFHPPDEGIYIIRIVKFVPVGAPLAETSKKPDQEEFRKKTENLRTLGYL